jgi:MFS family permease
MLPILDRERTVAPPGFNRWLVPPAALSIHLAIGQVYALSVFNLPLTKLIGITTSAPDDWKLSTVGWIFSVAIVFLGLSAAFLGAWLEKMGPRFAMFLAAIFFSSGFLVASLGVSTHQLWLLILGYGVLGPGMATGLAIMGFGGGAMIGAPMSVALMNHFQTPQSLGVSETFLVMGLFYFVFMMLGVCLVRIPAPNWKPNGYTPSTEKREMVTSANVSAANAIKTPQFWLLWVVLFLNVTAGIAVLSQASAMIQEMFQGHVTAAAAGGFVGLLSIFNMGGRFVWSSCSDYIGRKHTYMIFFALGALLYSLIPSIGAAQNIVLFVLGYGVILSMYGGGFATIPVYLKDLFGTLQVGAIHGRLLTAWSAAGVVGPALVNYIREYQLSQNVPKAQAYSVTMYIMAGLLVIGFIANFLVKPVDAKFATQEGGKRA